MGEGDDGIDRRNRVPLGDVGEEQMRGAPTDDIVSLLPCGNQDASELLRKERRHPDRRGELLAYCFST